MAAYAALVSVMNTMNQIQGHPRISTFFDKNQLESLGGTVIFLLEFIESYNCGGRNKEVEDLEAEISCAAHAAEDVIESHIVDQILAATTEKNGGLLQKIMRNIWRKPMKLQLPSVICDLQKVTEDMDSIKANVREVEKPGEFKDQTPHSASSRPVSARKTGMVGFDDYLINLLDRLTGQQSHQQVIPIIVMGGVGKTTLTRNAFENLLIQQHFDVCAWATISQSYSVREIFLELLSNQEGSKKSTALDEIQLGEQLHKHLFNRRYLIVLDDMWSIEVWEEIKFFFPDNNNGSRIILTSRLVDISQNFNSPYMKINFLDEDKSWNLFCQESFGEEGCPVEFKEVGKKICENCKGLPLSIVVIGGFLRKSSKTQEYWEDVARDTYSVLYSEGENQCMNILSLSYDHLPAHLKPCFLYMGVFEEDDEILVSRLIKLWVAEGLLRSNGGQSLEEVAEWYLEDLVDRNLILVNRWGSNGKIKGCTIHDLIRELCLRVAKKEKFICVVKLADTQLAITRERRIIIHESVSIPEVSHALESASLVRSLICKSHRRFNSRLLRVLRVVYKESYGRFPEADLGCVNLRCLDHVFSRASIYDHPNLLIPNKISFLWNLQMLRIRGYDEEITAPSEVWEMVQLRHLQVDVLCLPDPPRSGRVGPVLQNLQTLSRAMNFKLSEEVCKRVPNIMKLRLAYFKFPQMCDASTYYCPQNLDRLHKLESLTLSLEGPNWRHMVLNMTLPSSLKKLSVNGGNLYWEDLGMIGSLPNLIVLKLRSFSMIGSEWNPVEGEFRRLKFLQIHGCRLLTTWNADHFHFPVLEKLVLRILYNLDEIPLGIGEIPTLRIISLYNCNVHCALSAVKILEEQESLGNDDLQVEVGFHMHNKVDTLRFMERVEEEGFTSNNLHIKRVNSW